MAKGNHKHQPTRTAVKQDPLDKLNLTQEQREALKNLPDLSRYLVSLHDRSLDVPKISNLRGFIANPKFADRPEVVRQLALQAMDETDKLGPAAMANNAHNAPAPQRQTSGNGDSRSRDPRRQGNIQAGPAPEGRGGADPSVLGQPFHNPYTFIPFPEKAPPRRFPTLRTADELPDQSKARRTGYLDLDLITLSPLLTCKPDPVDPKAEHKVYQALTYGDDVIVPGTSVCGSLRSLMTILTGGTLDYVDEHLWLTQSRDAALGPGIASKRATVFLARIHSNPRSNRNIQLELGEVRLIDLQTLERLRPKLPRPSAGDQRKETLWCDEPSFLRRSPQTGDCYTIRSVSDQRDERRSWQIKLSGRPVNLKGKREAAFLGSGQIIELPDELWQDFLDRQRHGDITVFEKGDLVWLEHKDKAATTLTRADEIESVQWSRWGRKGQNLLDLIRRKHRHMLPDAWNPDGKVDAVSDLFGQIPRATGAAGPLAARIRPENAVFENAATKVEREVTLAPMLQPHPGCIAFYRDNEDPDRISMEKDGLRGYKVYRNTQERGKDAPWHYRTQPVLGAGGRANKPEGKVNKIADLLKQGVRGRLRIAFRGLTDEELGLLLTACSVDWRLGGGKPLGLGHVRVTQARLWFDEGDPVEPTALVRAADGYPAPAPLKLPFTATQLVLASRVQLWHESQRPVAKLRYPRAAQENRNNISRGGHVWFQRHALPRKNQDKIAPGLQMLYIGGQLQTQAKNTVIRPQVLPPLDASGEQKDVLFGYDLHSQQADQEQSKNRQTFHHQLEVFDEARHTRSEHRSGGRQGQNRDTRNQDRDRRAE